MELVAQHLFNRDRNHPLVRRGREPAGSLPPGGGAGVIAGAAGEGGAEGARGGGASAGAGGGGGGGGAAGARATFYNPWHAGAAEGASEWGIVTAQRERPL